MSAKGSVSAISTTNSASTGSTINENWKDTFYFGAGADYKLTDKLTLKGGVGYDQSPVTYSNRTTRIPDGDRFIVGIGAGYQITNSARVEFGYAHLFVGDVNINSTANAGSGTIVGKYNDSADSLGLSLTIKL